MVVGGGSVLGQRSDREEVKAYHSQLKGVEGRGKWEEGRQFERVQGKRYLLQPLLLGSL